MDDYAEVDHKEDCYWITKSIKKTVRWFSYMSLNHCPNCEGRVLNG